MRVGTGDDKGIQVLLFHELPHGRESFWDFVCFHNPGFCSIFANVTKSFHTWVIRNKNKTMKTSIELRNMRFFAYHGVLEHEAVHGNNFSVTLRFSADLSVPCVSDN